MARHASLAVLLLIAVSGCGPERRLSPDEYYKQASAAFEDKNFEVAVKSYKELLDQHPFSDHAEEAELRIAHSYYKNKQYAEGIAAFNDFQRMHPMSPHLPQVYYLLGRSYMDQMTTTDRDQAASENAHGWFRVVIDRYPESPYAAQARRKLAECRQALAEHELYIATYYFDRDNLPAGENRVKGLLENYPETTVATRALEELADAYAKAEDAEHEQLARAAFAERGEAPTRAVEVEALAATDEEVGESFLDGWVPFIDGNAEVPAPIVLDPSSTHGPAQTALLGDLTARFGAAQGVSTAATSPSLLDPPTPSRNPRAESQGPTGPISGGDARGGSRGGY